MSSLALRPLLRALRAHSHRPTSLRLPQPAPLVRPPTRPYSSAPRSGSSLDNTLNDEESGSRKEKLSEEIAEIESEFDNVLDATVKFYAEEKAPMHLKRRIALSKQIEEEGVAEDNVFDPSDPLDRSFLELFAPETLVTEQEKTFDDEALDPSDNTLVEFLEKLTPEQLAELDALWDKTSSQGLEPIFHFLDRHGIQIKTNSTVDKVLRGKWHDKPVPTSATAREVLSNLSEQQCTQLDSLVLKSVSIEPVVDFLTKQGLSAEDAIKTAIKLKKYIPLRTNLRADAVKLLKHDSILPTELKDLVGSDELPFPESGTEPDILFPESNVLSVESIELLQSTFNDEQRRHIESLWKNSDSLDPLFNFLREHRIPDNVSRQLANELHLNDCASRITGTFQAEAADYVEQMGLQLKESEEADDVPDDSPATTITGQVAEEFEQEDEFDKLEREIDMEEHYDPYAGMEGDPNDLRRRMPWHDSTEIFDIPASKDSPFHNRVIIHNHVPMFASPEELKNEGFENPDLNLEDSELTADEKAVFAEIMKHIKNKDVGVKNLKGVEKAEDLELKELEDAIRAEEMEVANEMERDEDIDEEKGKDVKREEKMTKRKQESVEENDENITKVRLPMYIDQKLFDSFFYRVLLKRRVTQQTGKGKKHRYATMVLIGNRNGIVGIGEAKHEDSAIATNAAKLDAVKRLDWVERFEDRTVWTNMETKLGGTRILMRPRPLGFGLRCNPHIHEILRAAGIKDVSAKVWGSRNPLNVIKATLRMLQAGHMPVNMGDGLGGRGRKMSKGSGIMPLDNMERARGRKLLPLMT